MTLADLPIVCPELGDAANNVFNPATLKITGLPLVTLISVSGRTATPVDFVAFGGNMFYVEIVNIKSDEVVERMGPMPERKAERVEAGASINLNHVEYHTRIVKA